MVITSNPDFNEMLWYFTVKYRVNYSFDIDIYFLLCRESFLISLRFYGQLPNSQSCYINLTFLSLQKENHGPRRIINIDASFLLHSGNIQIAGNLRSS